MTIIPFPGPKDRLVCGCGKTKRVRRLSLSIASREMGRIRFTGNKKATRSLLPLEALQSLDVSILQGNVPDLIELSGTGDPLADPERTLEALRMIHQKYPEIALGMTTLGIGGEAFATFLFAQGLTKTTMQIDAVDPEVAQKLYAWIRPGKKTLPLDRAVEVLVDEQARALRSFSDAGIEVTVRTTVYPGYNDKHIDQVAYRVAKLGAKALMIVPCKALDGETDSPPEPTAEMMDVLHARAAKYIKIVDGQYGCEEVSSTESFTGAQQGYPKPTAEKPNLAVVSSNGMDIDLHLGHAIRVLVYGPRKDGLICLLESRDAPEPGGGKSRWEALAETISDCFVILAASAGESPRKILAERGISVLVSEGEIEGTVDVLYGGGKKKKKK